MVGWGGEEKRRPAVSARLNVEGNLTEKENDVLERDCVPREKTRAGENRRSPKVPGKRGRRNFVGGTYWRNSARKKDENSKRKAKIEKGGRKGGGDKLWWVRQEKTPLSRRDREPSGMLDLREKKQSTGRGPPQWGFTEKSAPGKETNRPKDYFSLEWVKGGSDEKGLPE